MGKRAKLKESLDRIDSVFQTKTETKKERKEIRALVVRLNLFLLNAAFKKIQEGQSLKSLSLFTPKILNSENKHLTALIRQSEAIYSKQDIELLSYREFYSHNHFSLRRAVQWKFAKYIKNKEDAEALIRRMKVISPEAFKRHLVTLLKEENLTIQDIEEEAKRLEEQYLWKHGSAPQTAIPPI